MGESFRKLLRLQLILLAVFILNKFVVRPYVLEKAPGKWLEVIVSSLPNFIEGIVGIILLLYLVLAARRAKRFSLDAIRLEFLYLGVTLVAGVYVILQEFKVHNLGGRNTYDPYDVLFSVFGLLTGYLILWRWQPKL